MGEKAGDFTYEIRQKMNTAIRAIRDAEDYARLEGGWFYSGPNRLADRLREAHELISHRCLNGKTTDPILVLPWRDVPAPLEWDSNAGRGS